MWNPGIGLANQRVFPGPSDKLMGKEVKPRKIRLEASSVCQLRCPSCPNTSGAMQPTIGKGFLKPDDFQNLVDDNPWIREIELSNYGEMFLNPDLLEIIEYAHARQVLLRANNGVNLNYVHEEVLAGLVKCSFRSMTCSLDGASNRTYSRYRVNGDFERVVENIRKINSLKRLYQSRYPMLTWQFVVYGFNEHEISMARDMATALNMAFRLKLSWDPAFSPVRDQEAVKKEIGFASRREFEKHRGGAFLGNLCHQLWDQPQVNWDGKILGCCRNFWGHFGKNAFKDGLLKSINNESIQYARDMLVGKKDHRNGIPCATCSIYQTRKAHGRHLDRSLLFVALRYMARNVRGARGAL